MLNVEKVKEIMRTQKVNTSQLARKIGISPQHLSNILGESRGLSTETLKALAIALETEVANILDDTLTNTPIISLQEDGGIVVEKTSRLRITLPANGESYEFVKQLVAENEELDNKIQELLLKADKEAKEKILNILEAGEDKPD